MAVTRSSTKKSGASSDLNDVDKDGQMENPKLWLGLLGLAVLIVAAFVITGNLKHQPFRVGLAASLPIVFMYRGLKKRSLSVSGAVTGWVVACTHGLSNAATFADLVVFFLTGSKLTRYRAEYKKKIEGDYKEGGQRNWVQVLCNGGPAAVFSIALLLLSHPGETMIDPERDYVLSYLHLACMCAYACCCGDTWASEVGAVAGNGDPLLITTLQPVPRGTNGGVSGVGLGMSVLGGLCIGATHFVTLALFIDPMTSSVTSPPQWPIVVTGLCSGFIGSLLDSLLGATLQYSGWERTRKVVVNSPGADVVRICGRDLMDNHAVNLASVTATALAVPYFALQHWPSGHQIHTW